MESLNNVVCPVCTLYLRPGMTLENHLSSHPKQKVIEALIKATQLHPQQVSKVGAECVPSTSEQPTFSQTTNTATVENCWSQPASVNQQQPTNHSFIYQQFMSSSGTQPLINMNPMTQQFVAIPAVFNPQMFCPPYIFQQQQQVQIVSAGTNLPFIPRQPTDLFPNSSTLCASVTDMALRLDSNQPLDSSPKPAITNLNTCVSSCNEKSVIVTCDDKSEPVALITNTDDPPGENVVIINGYNETEIETTTISPVMYSNERSVTPQSSCSSPPLLQTADKLNESVSDVYDTKCIDKVEEPTSPLKDEYLDADKKEKEWTDERHEDLNKACQTIQTIVYKDTHIETVDILDDKCNEIEISTEDVQDPEERRDEIDLTADENAEFDESENTADEPYENKEIIINSEKTVNIANNDVLAHNNNVTILEMVDINLIMPSNLIQNGQSIISKVDDSECLNEANREDRPQILMNIGVEKYTAHISEVDKIEGDDKLEDLSRDSLNIRADERMPPRGELSEQESNGASEVGWGGKMYQEGSSGMSMSIGTSYDLLARESWEGSDCSDSEMPPLQSRVPPAVQYNPEADVDEVLIVDRDSPLPLHFICPACGLTFRCPKERRVHQANVHGIHADDTVIKKCVKSKVHNQLTPYQLPIAVDQKPIIDIKTEAKIEMDKDNIVTVVDKVEIKEETKENYLCYACGEMVFSQKELNAHNKKVHNIRTVSQTHVCKTCGEAFPSELKFAEHLKVHPLECHICGKHFYRIANLRLHHKRHLGVRPFKCEVCAKAFLTKQKLTEHHNVHTGNSPIKCTMCEETFRRYSNLVQHRNRHHFNVKKKVKDFVCPCGEIFHSKNKFNWHKEIHEPKPKSCRYCHEKFVHMASLTRHIRRAHNQRYVPEKNRERENVECQICNGVYLKSSLEAHLTTHSGKKLHGCNICNKEFTTKWNLKLHKWTHATANSKPYRCDLCQSAFVRQSDYVAHMNSHKSVRPYTCNYCGCKFIRKYNCLRHVREHEESKAYTCEVCNKSFHRSYYLKEHLRVHNGVRPFCCNICGKTSTTKSNHNKHMKIHHAREPISTEG